MSTGHLIICGCAECITGRASAVQPSEQVGAELDALQRAQRTLDLDGVRDRVTTGAVFPPPDGVPLALVIGQTEIRTPAGGKFVALVVRAKDGTMRAVYWDRERGLIAPEMNPPPPIALHGGTIGT